MKELPLPPHVIHELDTQFPKGFYTLEFSEREAFGRDWTRVYSPNPAAIVFPRSTEEVAKFMVLCNQLNIAVVPSGGRTGLSGGAVATREEIVLSLARMNQMEAVDVLAQTVKVQAGAVTQAVHEHCAPHGLTWPVDFASKGSSQVGGNISTNAGGVKVIHYGLTRDWVLGLQVVTPQGEILELNGALEKNNTGIDLRQLFIGSEGILGIITEATLKLTRLPSHPLDVFFFAVDGIPDVLQLFNAARMGPFEATAFEFLTHACLEKVLQGRGLRSPFSEAYPVYVLLEVQTPQSAEGKAVLDQWLESLFEKGKVKDGTLAQSPREAQELWALREGISESLSLAGFVHKNDIALPISQLQPFIDEMLQVFAHKHPRVEMYLFGHIGDGNLHVNSMKPKDMSREEFALICQAADQELFSLVKKYRGSISAEHGIGLLKKKALSFSRTEEEIRLMKSIKQVFDPKKILNPGKIFD